MKGNVFGKMGMIWGMIWGIVLLTGCKSVKYVPVETVRFDTTYINKVQRDSVVRYDSVYVREKGDTVWLEKFRYVYRDKWRTDTLYVNRTDSVRVPYPVERELGRWERVKMELGGWAFGIIIVAALVVVGWLVYRMRRR